MIDPDHLLRGDVAAGAYSMKSAFWNKKDIRNEVTSTLVILIYRMIPFNIAPESAVILY